MIGNCGKCEFWFFVGDPNEALNECRRYPPTTGKLITKSTYGCGEFKEKAVTPTKPKVKKK